MYVKKVEAKGRTQAELDQVIRWLTDYTAVGLARQTPAATIWKPSTARRRSKTPMRR